MSLTDCYLGNLSSILYELISFYFIRTRSTARMSLNDKSAAQYVRMSTDLQKYSIENQAAAIALYAAQNGIEIVRSYEDVGKSGLRIDRREGLKRLLSDVVAGSVNFTKILVYDVSRWGRFQDNDESAHYEFICREAGVNVEYCAEPFSNEGSVAASLWKNLQRAMAGEFSRELSAKVFAGQCRIVSLGYRNGSTPGYGLRRRLIDERGNPKMVLAHGERKSIATDIIVLVPGPADEVLTVHRVYSLFIDEKMRPQQIADRLNVENVPSVNGELWNYYMIRQLLINEKYIGNSIYNRTSQKLGANPSRNAEHEWVRKIGAFEPIVSRKQFHDAGERIQSNSRRYPKNFMLDVLTSIWCSKKRLTIYEIDACEQSPCRKTFEYHFGSIGAAYRLIGFRGRAHHSANMNVRQSISKLMGDRIRSYGGTFSPIRWSSLFTVNSEFTIAIVVAREFAKRKYNDWRFSYKSRQKPDLLIVARVDNDARIKDYYTLPYCYLPRGTWLTVSGLNYKRLESFRSEALEPFFQLCARKST